MKYQFAYGGFPGMTVTVKAKSYDEAVAKAREVMDARYEKRNQEPPVAWTLTLLNIYIG